MTNTLPWHYMVSTRVYLFAWMIVALIAASGAVDDFRNDTTTNNTTAELIFAITTVSISSIMVLCVFVELLHARCYSERSQSGGFQRALKWLHDNNIPNKVLHVFVQVLSVSSVAISAVYLHQENYNWHFGLCIALMTMVQLYNIFYVSSYMLDVALYTQLTDTQKEMVRSMVDANEFIWKKSQVDARLAPAAI